MSRKNSNKPHPREVAVRVKRKDVLLWQEAASFAARAHRSDIRKDGKTPYFAHPARVAQTLTNVFGCSDAVALAGAYLHDTIEDTKTDYEDLHERFGASVADLVATLTHNAALPETVREDEYYARLARGSWRAKAVKLADLHDNISDLANFPLPDREKKGAKFRRNAKRMIRLAEPEASKHACIRAGIDAVRALL